MEENKKILNDDDIEILDFDDEIPPKTTIDDDIEIIDFDDEETIDQSNNNLYINENINFNKEEKENSTNKVIKRKLKIKSIVVAIIIFIILIAVIISLPFINNYFMKKDNNNQNINQNNSTDKNKDNINIDVKQALNNIKDYTNFKYQVMDDIYSKDNKNSTLTIKSTYTYLFNETKFSVNMNKKISDFDYNYIDYYEKLDNVYNLYINDITTNKTSKRNIGEEEFNKFINIYPKTIEYLISNYKIIDKKTILVDGKNHINITLNTPKEILTNLSIKTDRLQNSIDINSIENDNVEVELYFDENEKLYQIQLEIEDKNAYLEDIDNEVESSVLRYIFSELNKVEDIELPK